MAGNNGNTAARWEFQQWKQWLATMGTDVHSSAARWEWQQWQDSNGWLAANGGGRWKWHANDWWQWGEWGNGSAWRQWATAPAGHPDIPWPWHWPVEQEEKGTRLTAEKQDEQ